MTDSRPRMLLASIHDVSPRFESEIERLLDSLRPHIGSKLALLVVPNHWGDAPIIPGSRDCEVGPTKEWRSSSTAISTATTVGTAIRAIASKRGS